MKAWLRSSLLGLAVIARDLVGTVLVLLAVGLSFLLFTQTGASLVLRAAQDLSGIVEVGGIEGRLWGSLRLRDVRVETEGLLLTVDQATLEWSPTALIRGLVQVDRLDVGEVVVAIRPTPEDEADSPPLTRLPVGIAVDAATLRRLELRLAGGEEPIVIDAIALSADWRAARIALRQLAATTPWVGAVALTGEAELLEDGIQVDSLQAEGFVQAQLQGRLGYTTPSDLRLRWQALQWPPQTDEPQVRSAEGELHWTGLFDDYRYELQAQLQAAELHTKVQARGRGSLSRLEAESLHATLLGGALKTSAVADWSGALRLDADGRVDRLDPSQLNPELKGVVNGRFQARSVVQGDKALVDFEAALQDSQLRGYPLALDVRGRYDGAAVTLSQALLRSGGSRLQASGRVYPELAAETRLDSPDLGALWPGLQGRAHLQATLRGDYARPAVRAQGRLDALRYDDIRVAQATLDADVDLAKRLQLRVDASQMQVGQDIRKLQLRVDGAPAQHRLELSADTADGRVALAAEGRLDLDRPGWNGTLTEGRLAPLRLAAWSLESAVPLAVGPGVDLQQACWRSVDEARACVRVAMNGADREFAVQLERFELGSLAPLLPQALTVRGRFDGTASATMDARGLRALDVALTTAGGELRKTGLPPVTWQVGELRAQETGEGLIATLDLPVAGGQLEAELRLAPGADLMQRALSGEAMVALPDLGFAKALSAEVQDVQGRIEGRFRFAGTLAAPEPQGRVELIDGALRLATPGTQLKALRASVDADGYRPLRVEARTEIEEGALYIGGEVDPWNDPLRLDLKLSGYNARVLRTPEVNLWIAPNLTIVMAQRELRVSGTVEVPRADILPKSLDGGVGPSGDQVIVRSDDAEREPAIAVFADIGLLLGKDVRFEGFGLKTRFAGKLQLREEPGTPTSGRGEINLLEGRYKAYGQDLTIETGRLLFTGGPVTAPAVELRATRQPREDITVGVLVRGTLDKPLLSLFSTPSMTQQQQLSWLVLGRDLEEAGGSEDQAMLAGAALSMGLAGGEWLAQRFGGGLGLDQISLGAKPGQTAEQAQFTVGKYLRPGLFISYGIGLFQPGHSFKLEYDIGRGFKLATESGVESGGDLLYTIERAAKLRESAPAAEPEPAAQEKREDSAE